jgi:hypothetical protein
MKRYVIAVAAILLAGACGAQTAEEGRLANWFNDPFIQVRSAIANCPVPLGPLLSQSEVRAQAHSRAERGTRCYFDGKCSKANSYLYDPDIAADLSRRFAKSTAFAGASLWITAQRRFVWVEGCVGGGGDTRAAQAALKAFVKKTPDVEYVLINVTGDAHGRIPYQTLEKTKARP